MKNTEHSFEGAEIAINRLIADTFRRYRLTQRGHRLLKQPSPRGFGTATGTGGLEHGAIGFSLYSINWGVGFRLHLSEYVELVERVNPVCLSKQSGFLVLGAKMRTWEFDSKVRFI